MKKNLFTSITWLVIAVLTITLLSACTSRNEGSSNSSADSASSGTDGEGSGTKVLNLLYTTNEANVEAIKSVLPDYEQKTGIRVELTSAPYTNLQQKVFQELANKSAHYDLMVIDTPWMADLTDKLLPITEFLEDPEVAATIELEDFIPKVFYDTTVYNPSKPWLHASEMDKVDLQDIKSQGFEIYGLPIQSNVLTMPYRKDLFDKPENRQAFKEQYGRELEPPVTWDEFLEVAQFFTRPNEQLWGTTLMPGVGDWGADDLKTFVAAWGGDGLLINDKLEPTYDTPETIEALTYYNDLINKHQVVPPGTSTFSWTEAGTAFGSGLTAMTMNYFTQTLTSNVEGGIIDYAMVPGNIIDGRLVQGPHFGTWNLSINKFSGNHKEAFDFVAWVTSSEVQQKMLQKQLHPTRISVYEVAQADPALTERFNNFYKTLGDSLAIGVGRPRTSNAEEIWRAVATGLNNIVTGKGTIEENLASSKKQVITLLEQAGYKPGQQ
ncbi:ABC transporter substrate-binding protein [Paenibacillus abyssi]|uniref:ABC transporter substrate-binding protein n=1 Tax=Paenibacillus abyssi TaxID=1340531 RepID=A0A917CVN0_9BACL|nr:sugar ABC transporter substrate-binding protein [Paenibacillus abyssi]GGG01267.1 ABC transporter substrate-binding protein [Paenibacillus abyssi]